MRYLGRFCGSVDLSCQKGASDALRTFSINCIQLGVDIHSQVNRNINVSQILNPLSDKTIRNSMLSSANNDFDEKVQNLKKYKYLCLLCDAGTVLKLHVLHFMLVRFNDPCDILLFETYDVQNSDSMFYHKCFYDVFKKLDHYNLNVSAITFDKLPAQRQGFNTFQKTSGNPFIEAVLEIPCFGHMCNNVFLDMLKDNKDFKDAFIEIMATASLLRTKNAVDFIGAKCPSISKTRWIFIADVLLFMKIHKDSVNNFIEIYNQTESTNFIKFEEKFDSKYNLVILLKIFSLIVENNDFELYNIVPLVIEFFTQIEILYNSANNETFKLIIDNLDLKMRIRLLNNAYYPTLTAYCLSSVGRIELRKKYFGIRTIDNPGTLCLSPTVYKIYDEQKKFEYKLHHGQIPDENDNPIIDNFTEEEEDIEEEESEFDVIKEIDEQIAENDIEVNEDEDIKNFISSILETPFAERIHQDIYINIYENAKRELFRICSLINIDLQYVEKKLDDFLFGNPMKLGFIQYSYENPNVFWRKAFSARKDWEIFADLALRYSSVFSTETIVERTFSEQKYIQNQRMTNVSSTTIKARLWLHQQKQKQKKK